MGHGARLHDWETHELESIEKLSVLLRLRVPRCST
jgi:hypothetical protein